jgi:transcriptional regulator with XRE-family HTH domain
MVYYAVELVFMIKSQTHLGQFLQTLREERGFQSIQEYVRRYKLPVSYVYYTEVESGKKRIALETSKQLCAALEADQTSFYYHLLKDILPKDIQADFLSRIPIQQILDKQEKENKAQSINMAYRKNQLSRMNKQIFYASNKSNAYLNKHPQLFPLLSAIYCVDSTSDNELEQLATRLGVNIPIDEVLTKFEELGIIECKQAKNASYKIIKRKHNIIVTNDQSIFASVIKSETEIAAKTAPTNYFHGMLGLSKQKQEELRTHLLDLDAEFDAYHLENPDGIPQLMTIVFSSAKEYLP